MWGLKDCGGHHPVSAHLWSGILSTHPPVPHPCPGKTEGWGPWLCLWEELQQLQQELQPQWAEPSLGSSEGQREEKPKPGKGSS